MNKQRINSLVITFFLLMVSAHGIAQDVVLSTDTLSADFKRNRYKYFSIDQYEQRTLYKIGGTAGQNGTSFFNEFLFLPFDQIAIERKLSRVFSAEVTYYIRQDQPDALSARIRYYLSKRNEGSPNNMSGNYLAIEYARRFNGAFTGIRYNDILGSDKTLLLYYGRQLKRTTYGYADIHVFANHKFDVFKSGTSVGFNVVLGGAWGPSKSVDFIDEEELAIPDLNKKILLTIDNPTLSYGQSFKSLGFKSSLEWSPIKLFTLSTRLGTGVSRQESVGLGDKLDVAAFGIDLQLRKYWSISDRSNVRRISGVFSGPYTAYGVDNLFVNWNINADVSSDSNLRDEKYTGSDRWTHHVAIGYQELVGSRFFFDINCKYDFFTRNRLYSTEKGPSALIIGTRVGILIN